MILLGGKNFYRNSFLNIRFAKSIKSISRLFLAFYLLNVVVVYPEETFDDALFNPNEVIDIQTSKLTPLKKQNKTNSQGASKKLSPVLDKKLVPVLDKKPASVADKKSKKNTKGNDFSSIIEKFDFDEFEESYHDLVVPNGSVLFELKIAKKENKSPVVEKSGKKQASAIPEKIKSITVNKIKKVEQIPLVFEKIPVNQTTNPAAIRAANSAKISAVTPTAIPAAPPAVTPAVPQLVVKKEQTDNAVINAIVSSAKPNNKGEKQNASTEKEDTNWYDNLAVEVMKTKEPPSIKFSGDICSFGGTIMQNDSRDGKDGTFHIGFGWGDLGMAIAGRTEGDVEYKYVVNLEVVPANGIAVNENYFEIQSGYGTFQMGNVKGPDGTFCDGAASLLGGTGGVTGSFGDFYNKPGSLPNDKQLAGYTKRATKAVYYTARIFGFQLGVGFCPNPNHIGWGSLGSNDYAGSNSNDDDLFNFPEMKRKMSLSYGINYEQKINDVLVKFGLVAVKEQSSVKFDVDYYAKALEGWTNEFKNKIQREIKNKEDISYQVSGSLKYKNLQVAGGFINNGKFNLPSNSFVAGRFAKEGIHSGDAGKAWDVGASYDIGCFSFALAKHKTTRNVTGYSKAENNVKTATVDCQIIQGVKLFVEINHVATSADKLGASLYNQMPKNEGKVIMIGSKISF